MSDFWKLSVIAKNEASIQMQVWAVYEDCQYFQCSKDWVLSSLYCANENISEMIVKEYNQIELEEDPDIPSGQLTGEMDLSDPFPRELLPKIISQIALLRMENVPALPEFWTQIYHSDEHLHLLPTAVYEVVFADKKFVDAFVIGEKWDSPCFDMCEENDLGIDKEKLSFGENPNYLG
jgi:hypothetical protein